MKLQITEPVKLDKPYPNTYSVKIDVMHGDADHFESFTVPGFRRGNTEDEALLGSLLVTLKKMSNAFPMGRGGSDEYAYWNVVPEFESWFSSADIVEYPEELNHTPKSDNELELIISLAKRVNSFYSRTDYVDWPRDISMSDGIDLHGEASLDSYEVRYHDDAGIEYHVDIEL